MILSQCIKKALPVSIRHASTTETMKNAVVHKANIARIAVEHKHLAKEYSFRKADMRDFNVIMDMSRRFVLDEPLGKAVGVTDWDSLKSMIEFMNVWSLQQPPAFGLNLLITHRETSKPIGFRTASVEYRNPKDDPVMPPEPKYTKKQLSILQPMEEMMQCFWKKRPQEQKCLHGNLLFMERDHRGTGLGLHIISMLMDFDQLTRHDVNYYVSIATNPKTAKIEEKQGFVEIEKGPRAAYDHKGVERKLQNRLHIADCDMRVVPAYDLHPHWERMRKAGELGESIKETAKNIAEKVQSGELEESLRKNVDSVKAKAEDLSDSIKENTKSAKAKAEDLSDSFKENMKSAKEKAEVIGSNIKDNYESAKAKVEDFSDGLKQNVKSAKEKAEDLSGSIKDTAKSMRERAKKMKEALEKAVKK